MGKYKSEKFAEFKRRAILDSASAEFTSKGLEKATMRGIAAGADLTTGAVYTMFKGKEDIYAELLSESLTRLHTYVREQTDKAKSPGEGVRAAVKAFFDYYVDRHFEVQLGMHSFSGFKHSSLGQNRDKILNDALIGTLDIFSEAIETASPTMPKDQVRKERDAIFSGLMGALVLAHTGRAESIGSSAETVLNTHITALLQRL